MYSPNKLFSKENNRGTLRRDTMKSDFRLLLIYCWAREKQNNYGLNLDLIGQKDRLYGTA